MIRTKAWRRLYEAAIRVKEIAPWAAMTEADLFGVQSPETGELGFVSVMGLLGQQYGLVVYLGPKGLYGFWEVEQADPETPPERILEIPHLQALFEDRSQLQGQDLKLIKALGLKFRGRAAWPMFRSVRPGFLPWFLEMEEVRFLTHALEQAAHVLLRVKEDPSLLEPRDEESYLVRIPHQGAWEDRIIRVSPPEPTAIPIAMDPQMLKRLAGLRQSAGKIEIDFFMAPAVMGKRETRPCLSYVLMLVEAQQGLVIGFDLLKAEPSLEAMWGRIPEKVAHQFDKAGFVPKETKVRSRLLHVLLTPLAAELKLTLKQSRKLPSLDSAKQFLLQR